MRMIFHIPNDDLAKALEEAAAAYEETLNKPESDRTGT